MRRRTFFLGAVLIFSAFLWTPALFAAESKTTVSATNGKVELRATAGIEQVKSFTLDSPKRLVVDLYGVRPGSHKDQISLDAGFKLLRVGKFEKNRTRFVFDVDGEAFPHYELKESADAVVVAWGKALEQPAPAQTVPPQPASKSASHATITAVDFSREENGSNFFIGAEGTAVVRQPVTEGNSIQLIFGNTALSKPVHRVYDTFDFPTSILSVTPYQIDVEEGPETHFVIILKSDFQWQLRKHAKGFVMFVKDGGAVQ